MCAKQPITFSICLTYGNHFVARSQTWIIGSHSYWARSWPMIEPWWTSSKILVQSKMADVRLILDFVRMDLSAVRSQYLIMWNNYKSSCSPLSVLQIDLSGHITGHVSQVSALSLTGCFYLLKTSKLPKHAIF